MVVEEIHKRRPNLHPAPGDLSNINYIGPIKALSSRDLLYEVFRANDALWDA